MTHETTHTITLDHDLGTFEGFNFRDQGAIYPNQSAEEMVNWDHDKNGEAEFWPAGDNEGVFLVFEGQSSVTCTEVKKLDALLSDLGSDDLETFVRIRCAETSILELTAEDMEDQNLHVYTGGTFIDLRNEAAYELFELYYPEAYAAWETSLCDGLIFDPDRFLDSPSIGTQEFTAGDEKILVVEPF